MGSPADRTRTSSGPATALRYAGAVSAGMGGFFTDNPDRGVVAVETRRG